MTSTTASTGLRCYGYTPDGDIIDHEATVIRGVVSSVLGGYLSMRGVVAEMNANGITTTTGGPWQLTPLVRLLTNPRLAGLAPKRRGTTNPAPPIISLDQHDQLLAAAADRRSRATQRQRTTRASRLLSGLVHCGRCGTGHHVHRNHSGPAYRCPTDTVTVAGISCGGTQIQAVPLEEWVTGKALDTLADPHRPDLRIRPASGVTADQLRDRLDQLNAHRAQAADLRRAGVTTPAEYEQVHNRIKKRRRALRLEIARVEAEAAAMPQLPGPDEAHTWWAAATLEDRRLVLGALWDHITVDEPTRRGMGGLDTERIRLVRHRTAARRAS